MTEGLGENEPRFPLTASLIETLWLEQWFPTGGPWPTGGPQAVFRWAMAPFRILVCLNSLRDGEKHLS